MQELLPKDWYTAKITQVYFKTVKEAKKLFICFTVDSGEYSYQHVIREYPTNKYGIEKLTKDFLEMGFVVYKDQEDDLFLEQFEDLRCEMHVDRGRVGDVIKNYILELKRTTREPDYNVSKPKSDDHFYEQNKGRDLPTWKKDSGTTKKKRFKK